MNNLEKQRNKERTSNHFKQYPDVNEGCVICKLSSHDKANCINSCYLWRDGWSLKSENDNGYALAYIPGYFPFLKAVNYRVSPI